MPTIAELETVAALIEQDPDQAVIVARQLVSDNPGDEAAVRLLALAVGRSKALHAGDDSLPVDPVVPAEVAAARQLLVNGRDDDAEVAVRAFLKDQPNNPDGLLLMADIAMRCGFPIEADRILLRAIALAPHSVEPRLALSKARHRIGRVDDSLQLLEQVLTLDPSNIVALSFKPALLVQLRRLNDGLEAFDRLITAWPRHARGWMNYAFLLKTVGRYADGVAAYRTAVALDPREGGAWWGLANLKTAKFFSDDIDAMLAALDSKDLPTNDRIEIHFALAKALDSTGDAARAFVHLESGNRLRRAAHPYDPDITAKDAQRTRRIFTAGFLAERSGWGATSRDPIFIVGMPRSGSTLIEQILASHPQIEGTEELFDVQRLAGELTTRHERTNYLDIVEKLTADDLREVGERYLADTVKYRRTDRPYFTDKMPGNWAYLGLIHLMLPYARIIDARRHPLDCCFSNYSQHFQWGTNFAYGLEDLGRYYRNYATAMQHFDTVLPGRIHRVIHERLIDDPETEVRRMLDYLGLPFDERCMRFHETERAVHTPSSEQVRRPISREGTGRWRPYAHWLGPLENALGDVLECYPDIPRSLAD